MRDEVRDAVALWCGVFGVRANVQIQPCPVLQEHVGGPPPVDHPPEQIARDFVRRQAALAPERAGHAVLVLQAEDPPVHPASVDAAPGWNGRAFASGSSRRGRETTAIGRSLCGPASRMLAEPGILPDRATC